MIGDLGSPSLASTPTYYRELEKLTRGRPGGLHSPDRLIRSVDFDGIAKLQAAPEWKTAGRVRNTEAAVHRRGPDWLRLEGKVRSDASR